MLLLTLVVFNDKRDICTYCPVTPRNTSYSKRDQPSQTNVATEMGLDPQKVAQVGSQGRTHSGMEGSGCYIGVLKTVLPVLQY